MRNTMPTVFIVDDDQAVRDSLALLIMAQGMRTATFPSAQDFLDNYSSGEIGCLVLDIRMPQITGLALQEMMKEKGLNIPTIFITGHGDIEQCRRAFHHGAIDFLTKPIDQERLLDSLRKGIRESIQQQQQDAETQDVLNRLSRITEREREVLNLVADGMSSKEIAKSMDLSPRTIEVHRSNLFGKLGVDSLADLVRFYFRALESTGKQRKKDTLAGKDNDPATN